MALADEIASQTNGAHFLRGDLHIHSFGSTGSYDVKDPSMTPENIVDAAIKENLKVIAIADHNTVGNVRAAIRHAQDKDILVVPAIELSTQQGHLLIYCPTPDTLEGFCGRLKISKDKRSCHDTMPQCLAYASEFHGIGILAHVDQDAGLEHAHPKFDTFKQEILNCKNLLGIEITHPNNALWFSHLDSSADRKNCAKLRREALNHETDVHLAKVMASDAHAMTALGRNAAGNKRLTRFKMESLTFEALRVALLDCTARVRLEELVPQSIPHFVGMKLEGGFLKDQIVHFNRNLTCIIGGRGAGKSTMLESLCACSGNPTDGNTLIDSDVWPDCISLIYEDEVGQQHTLTRSKLNDVANADPNAPVWIGIESYGQGETAETIQHCDKDPKILLAFLDRFIDLKLLWEADEDLRTKLLNNQTEIERLQHERNQIGGIEKAKQLADSQLATLKTQNVREVVELEQKLAQERVFRTTLQEQLGEFASQVTEGLKSDTLRTLIEWDGTGLAVGKDQFETVKKILATLADDVDKSSGLVTEKVKVATQKISEQLSVWIQKEKETREKIEDLRRELEKQKIPLDMAFIRKVTKDAIDYAAKLESLKKSIPKQAEVFKLRHKLMSDRRELRSKIFTTRQAFATTMNDNLATCVVDYAVHLKFHEGTLSNELEDVIKEAMGWRTAAVPKAKLIAAMLSPMNLMIAIDKKNTSSLEAIVDQDGNKVFSKAEAQQILDALGQWDTRCRIERCPFEDRPEVKVTRVMKLPNGTVGIHSRDFSQLSLGQQQAILLTVLLFSKSRMPLIIDQPEDNLDGEFVYTTLVRSLRGIKEARQVIVVTHNANIAVLGDAELIIPLRGAAEHAIVRDRGSIDTKKTRDLVCTILEGSPKAFLRRHEMYGY